MYTCVSDWCEHVYLINECDDYDRKAMVFVTCDLCYSTDFSLKSFLKLNCAKYKNNFEDDDEWNHFRKLLPGFTSLTSFCWT